MDKSSQSERSRKLVRVRAEWSIPQIHEALIAALNGSGPALTFGDTRSEMVPDQCAVVIPTSGSTGTPKEVALSSSALFASARASHKFLGANKGDRWSLLLPITHIAGVNVLIRAIDLGTDVVDMSADAEFTAIVPTQLHRALHGETQLLHHLQSVNAVLVGGAASSEALLQQARDANINVVTTYGMSEMSGGCIYDHQPLEGVRINIDERGAIELAGPMQAMGYLNAPEIWSELTHDGWFTTNDSGEIREGKLFISGRLDDQINSGGKKISLSVVDDFLHEQFPRQRFASASIPDSEWGEKLVLAIDGNLDSELLKSSLREKFGAHAVPKEIRFNVEIPLISIGKPDRKKVRDLFEIIAP